MPNIEASSPQEFEFIYRHPPNGCPQLVTEPVIKKSFQAFSRKSALALAENEPVICEGCRNNYVLETK